ncbi:MAG TPA: PAS domain S-box protein [Egibacteraceae bacterium]|nr:PAS domain S-box protein [Egibacteraceae bacterium]
MEVHAVLPAHPASARRGRLLAADAVRRRHPEDLAEEVSLLVSEIVTNSILHAGSDIQLRVVVHDRLVRVEVHDGSSVVPVVHESAQDDMTGRGLGLVELLASRWGADRQPDGKVVWFEIGEPASPASGEEPPSHQATESQDPTGATVWFLGAPVRLCRAVQRHNDALLREFALEAFAQGVTAGVSEHLGLMAALHVQLDRELAVDTAVHDLVLTPPTTSAEAIAALLATLERADELARQGRLLSPPALPEIVECRLWLLREVVTQLGGGQPTAWASSATVDEEMPVGGHEVIGGAILDQLAEGIIVADPANRIVHANPAAERLFGWDPGALAGRRLTTIIPDRLREAHIAGFSRYLLTGEERLIGQPVRVPGRCRDGTERPVELMLSSVRLDDGRRLLVGAVRPAAEQPQPAPDAADIDAVAEALGVLRDPPVTSASEAAERLLPVLGASLGYRFGAFWRPLASGEALECASVWQDRPSRAPTFTRITCRQRFRLGVGLPGRVWEARRPLWIADVVADANFPRLGAAIEEGLRAGFAFPVIADRAVVGVVEFFTDEPQSPRAGLLAAVAVLGHAAGGYDGGG